MIRRQNLNARKTIAMMKRNDAHAQTSPADVYPPVLRPIGDFPGAGPLLVLDVDGVLNKFHPDQGLSGPKKFVGPRQMRVRTAHNDKYLIDWDDELVDALSALIVKHDLELGWLTTWGPNVRALIEQAFENRLAGGFVLKKQPALYRGARPADWKFTGVEARIAQTRQRWVWVDDEAVLLAEAMGQLELPASGQESLIAGVPGLAIVTNENTGLTLEQVKRIDTWLES